MSNVLIIFTADKRKSESSMKLFAVASTFSQAIKLIRKKTKLSPYDVLDLNDTNATQSLETNFIIKDATINHLINK